jgi:hypothetical protein
MCILLNNEKGLGKLEEDLVFITNEQKLYWSYRQL